MKTNILTIIAIITTILLTSCEKEIEFKGEQTDPKLVINSIVEPGQPIKARISKSVFFLDNEQNTEAPDDLVATLYVNGNRIGEMRSQTDTVWATNDHWSLEDEYSVWEIYALPYCPAVGDEVKITASANGFDDVEGSTGALPDLPNCQIKDIRLIDTESWPVSSDMGDTTWQYYDKYELTLEITDTHPGQTDFYKLSIDRSYHFFEDYDHYQYHSMAYIEEYDDPIFGTVSLGDLDLIDYQMSDPNGTFTDQFFDGRSYAIKLPIGFSYPKFDGLVPEGCRVAIYMEHITKDYYNYLNTCNQGDEVDQFFAEPIQTHTNVNGGYGIVGGRTMDTLWFALPQEE